MMKKKKITPNGADEPNSLDEYELTDDTTSQAVSINELTQCSTSSITIGHSVDKKYKELEEITQRACLHLDDDTIMLKPGLRLDFDRFMRALHAANNQNCNQENTARGTGTCIEEGIFRYNILQNHQKSVGYDIAVCSEDANAVIKKVSYNSTTNKFSGFPISLKHGIPCSRQFETDSFDELKSCFENKDKTYYLNVHMVKPLIASNPYSSPLLLVAYGINNNFKAIDVLNRWIWMFENARQSNVRIVAFATDCDPRYLLAMRLATGFFGRINNMSICDR
ncbi:unnamed protein product [Rotaria socialis]